jgi:hypothetical protein
MFIFIIRSNSVVKQEALLCFFCKKRLQFMSAFVLHEGANESRHLAHDGSKSSLSIACKMNPSALLAMDQN